MKKYLIEVPHGADKQSCEQAIQVFKQTGSHLLAQAEWGCMDGVHKAWIVVSLNSKEEARSIIPPAYRNIASIIQLTSFKSDDISKPTMHHQD
jgi:hypothetical protein